MSEWLFGWHVRLERQFTTACGPGKCPGNALDQFAVEQIYDLITIRIRPVAADKGRRVGKMADGREIKREKLVCAPASLKQMANNVII